MDSASPPTDNPLTRLMVVTGFSSLLLLPLMMYGCRPEWARWDAAQAVIAYDRGDMEQAIYQLTTAVQRSPRDPRLKISLALKLIESGRGGEAEVLCDEILDRFPENDQALIAKVHSQQSQGNFQQALETFNLRSGQRNSTIGNNANLLNERAYFRALAGVQLENAKQDINRACAIVSRLPMGSLPWELGVYQRSLVASGIVAMRIGMEKPAIEKLSKSIDSLRATLHASRIKLNSEIVKITAGQYPPPQEAADSQNDFRSLIRVREQALATLLTVRALAYQLVCANDLRDQDRAEVRNLSLNCDEIAKALPDDNECIVTLQNSSAFLDTRGYIIGLMPMGSSQNTIEVDGKQIAVSSTFGDALRDLDQSIFAFEVFENSLATDIHNHAESYVQDPIAEYKLVGRQKAALLYHRLVVRKRSGDLRGSLQDAEAIRALGCEPGAHLF